MDFWCDHPLVGIPVRTEEFVTANEVTLTPSCACTASKVRSDLDCTIDEVDVGGKQVRDSRLTEYPSTSDQTHVLVRTPARTVGVSL